jgi:putative membrane protein
VRGIRPKWLDEGADPDYRFSLANERTFLAWIRTALALIAASVAIVQLVPPFRIAGMRTFLGVALAIGGTVTAGLSYRRWARNEKAMRNGRSLPYTGVLPILGFGLGLIGLVVLVVVLVEHR